MIILGILLAAFFPRVLLVILWLTTTLVSRAFDSFFIPLLGLIFLPFTTLAYILLFNPLTGGLTAFNWFWVLLALVIDLSSYGAGGYKASHKQNASTANQQM
jgi:hypothetical protein